MSDKRHLHLHMGDEEPSRDRRLGALLRDVAGDVPMASVDWPALAARIGAGVRAQQHAPWWSYVERWQRRAVPIAIAAGIAGLLAFWGTSASPRADVASAPTSADLVSEVVVSATSPADAARSFLGTVTTTTTDAGFVEPE